ncbi:hypothetical protein [Mangrovibacterium lignilyticum]|uniref:hypothetical protein n=1 Tax=Mangrovibacterium lignilyticum TaxID=2668052 RepID=UPI0013D54B5F|nr:hypothetical protein [Mangrovibacterium lignilyticum]
MMKRILLLCSVLFVFSNAVSAQPDVLAQLKERYDIPTGFNAIITLTIDVPGIEAPQKKVEIEAQNDGKIKVKGEGLILLPKKGLMKQFTELLNQAVHWIETGENEAYQTFKLVSLDPKSDWVTADIKLLKAEPRIDEMVLTTKDAGLFTMVHHYSQGNYPDQTIVSFETTRFSVPLKFLGKSDGSKLKDTNGLIKGQIQIDFDQLEIF